MDIKKVGVVGCGLMGSGIAEVCARAGYDTVVREVDDAVLARGLARLDAVDGRAPYDAASCPTTSERLRAATCAA